LNNSIKPGLFCLIFVSEIREIREIREKLGHDMGTVLR
jgi:hypothetical protein